MVVGAKIKENQQVFYRTFYRLRQENCFENCRKKGFNFCCLILKSHSHGDVVGVLNPLQFLQLHKGNLYNSKPGE